MAKKRRRRSRRKPPSIGKVVKFGIIAVLAGSVAFEAGRFSLILWMQKTSPETVQTLLDDPVSALLIAQKANFTKPDHKLEPKTVLDARDALKQDPLRTLPIRMLSLWNLEGGNQANATRLNLLSQKVTRRDLYTQIKLIGHAAEEGDVGKVLAHYDRALRVHPQAGELLFPLLANAVAEKSAMEYMAPLVREPAPWFDEFVRSIVRKRGASLRNVARLLIYVGPSEVTSVPPTFVPEMIENLIGDGQAALAQQLLIASLDKPDAVFRDPSINDQTTDSSLGPFGWTANNGGGISASIGNAPSTKAVGSDDAVSISIFANPNEKKLVLRRFFGLAPGTYRYSETRDVLTKDASSASSWLLSCLTDEGAQVIWRSSDKLRPNTVTVPNNSCDFQMLGLEVYGGDGETGIEFIINDFDLQKL